MTQQKLLGTPRPSPGTWVQTERSSHEAWGRLSLESPKAAALLHVLCARMDRGTNALATSQEILAKLLGVSLSTVKRAIAQLEAGRWIQVVSIGRGAAKAYVVNARVAWTREREVMGSLAYFQASVLVDAEDQTPICLEREDLRRIPVLYRGESQLPSGPGEPPPSQPALEGYESELPSLRGDQPDLPIFEDGQPS